MAFEKAAKRSISASTNESGVSDSFVDFNASPAQPVKIALVATYAQYTGTKIFYKLYKYRVILV